MLQEITIQYSDFNVVILILYKNLTHDRIYKSFNVKIATCVRRKSHSIYKLQYLIKGQYVIAQST